MEAQLRAHEREMMILASRLSAVEVQKREGEKRLWEMIEHDSTKKQKVTRRSMRRPSSTMLFGEFVARRRRSERVETRARK